MSKRSATVFTIFIIAIIAFCLANVFAAMTGTYSLNLFNDDNETEVNVTNDSVGGINIETSSGHDYSKNHEDTYDSSEKQKQESTTQPSDDSGSSSQTPSEDTYETHGSTHSNG